MRNYKTCDQAIFFLYFFFPRQKKKSPDRKLLYYQYNDDNLAKLQLTSVLRGSIISSIFLLFYRLPRHN